jgi:hypothetical protein
MQDRLRLPMRGINAKKKNTHTSALIDDILDSMSALHATVQQTTIGRKLELIIGRVQVWSSSTDAVF